MKLLGNLVERTEPYSLLNDSSFLELLKSLQRFSENASDFSTEDAESFMEIDGGDYDILRRFYEDYLWGENTELDCDEKFAILLESAIIADSLIEDLPSVRGVYIRMLLSLCDILPECEFLDTPKSYAITTDQLQDFHKNTINTINELSELLVHRCNSSLREYGLDYTTFEWGGFESRIIHTLEEYLNLVEVFDKSSKDLRLSSAYDFSLYTPDTSTYGLFSKLYDYLEEEAYRLAILNMKLRRILSTVSMKKIKNSIFKNQVKSLVKLGDKFVESLKNSLLSIIEKNDGSMIVKDVSEFLRIKATLLVLLSNEISDTLAQIREIEKWQLKFPFGDDGVLILETTSKCRSHLFDCSGYRTQQITCDVERDNFSKIPELLELEGIKNVENVRAMGRRICAPNFTIEKQFIQEIDDFIINASEVKENLDFWYSKVSPRGYGITSRRKGITERRGRHERFYKKLGVPISIPTSKRGRSPLVFCDFKGKDLNSLMRVINYLPESMERSLVQLSKWNNPICHTGSMIIIFDHLLQLTRCSISAERSNFSTDTYAALHFLIINSIAEFSRIGELAFAAILVDVVNLLTEKQWDETNELSEMVYFQSSLKQIYVKSLIDCLRFPKISNLIN